MHALATEIQALWDQLYDSKSDDEISELKIATGVY